MEHKAICLVRVSTMQQELESQTQQVKQQALSDGYSEENIYIIEDKESGTKLSDEERNGLNRLKALIEEDKLIDAVYAYEISRISRRPSTVYSIRDLLIKNSIQLIIITPFFKMLNPDGTLNSTSTIFFGIFSSMAEQEGYLRQSRVMRGKIKKQQEGKLTAGKPLFGYNVDKDKNIIINEEESKIVKEIYRRIEEGESGGMIAEDMWLRGTFGHIRLSSVRCRITYILRDERYTGTGIYKQIISNNQFEKVTAIREKRMDFFAKKTKTKEIYICAGKIFSEEGYVLTPCRTTKRYCKMNNKEIINISISMNLMHKVCLMALKRYIGDVGQMNVEEERLNIRQKREQTEQKIVEIDLKIKDIENENDRIENRIIKGRLVESKGDKMIDDNISAIDNLRQTQNKCRSTLTELDNRLIYITSFLYDEQVQLDTLEHQQEAVKRWIKKIVLKRIDYGHYQATFSFIEKEYVYEMIKYNKNETINQIS